MQMYLTDLDIWNEKEVASEKFIVDMNFKRIMMKVRSHLLDQTDISLLL